VQSRSWMDITAIAVTIMIVITVAVLYVNERSGPQDARTARALVSADTRELLSRLRLRVTPGAGAARAIASESEECGTWQGGRQVTSGPHLQHSVRYTARPPAGRAPTGLARDAESVLRENGYRIVTAEVNFASEPPPGIVLAKWGWGDAVEITLWPEPRKGTVEVIGTARCLPVSTLGPAAARSTAR
jgi:hypothetical protein